MLCAMITKSKFGAKVGVPLENIKVGLVNPQNSLTPSGRLQKVSKAYIKLSHGHHSEMKRDDWSAHGRRIGLSAPRWNNSRRSDRQEVHRKGKGIYFESLHSPRKRNLESELCAVVQ